MKDGKRNLSMWAWGYLTSYYVLMLLLMATGINFLWWAVIGILGMLYYNFVFYPYLKKLKELEAVKG